MSEKVILVDEADNVIGSMDKLEAHQKGVLHRAFSIILYKDTRVLLQQRSMVKYHSAGLWTNTCCSHPRENESVLDAANRRLMEEMGVQCALRHSFSFIYKGELENGLIEHELDYVLFGEFSGNPLINTDEVSAFEWIEWVELLALVDKDPAKFTLWFKILLREYKEQIENELKHENLQRRTF